MIDQSIYDGFECERVIFGNCDHAVARPRD
jgi:hypothetical protein